MEATIKAGGSVLHNGVIHWQIGSLPSEADLATGDPQQEAIVAAALDTQIAALQRERERLALALAHQSPTINPPHTHHAAAPGGTIPPLDEHKKGTK
jgi:hypothetical protein